MLLQMLFLDMRVLFRYEIKSKTRYQHSILYARHPLKQTKEQTDPPVQCYESWFIL